jgi:hypothetical protein
MSNLKQWILRAADGESIEAIVIGKPNQATALPTKVDVTWARQDDSKYNKVLSWQEAEPLIDYPFDSSYGLPRCHAVTAWTKSRVIFVSQYNGATSIEYAPRNPVNHMPAMPGGW